MKNQYDTIYEEIASEMETGKTEKGLWTRLFAECNGDEQKTKVLYIKQRAEKLISAERARLEQEASERVAEAERAEAIRLEQLRGTADARLVAAINDGNWSTACTLLREGVKPDGLDEMGHSLTELARKKNDRPMIQLLESYDNAQVTSAPQTIYQTHKIGEIISAPTNDELYVRIEQSSNENFIMRVWNGNAGLAMSYWIYGVIASFIWGISLRVLQPVPGSGTAKLFLTCMVAYFFVVYVGIWRAANKYQGKKVWVSLAKFAVVLGALVTVVPVIVGLFQSAVS